MKRISLAQMKSGRKGKVVEIAGGGDLERKLMNMGIYVGREVTKVGHLALRGPVTIRSGRTVLALAHSISRKIKIEAE